MTFAICLPLNFLAKCLSVWSQGTSTRSSPDTARAYFQNPCTRRFPRKVLAACEVTHIHFQTAGVRRSPGRSEDSRRAPPFVMTAYGASTVPGSTVLPHCHLPFLLHHRCSPPCLPNSGTCPASAHCLYQSKRRSLSSCVHSTFSQP